MQVEVDVKCMQTKFGGCGNFGVTHSYFSKKMPQYRKGKLTNLHHKYDSKNLMHVRLTLMCVYIKCDYNIN